MIWATADSRLRTWHISHYLILLVSSTIVDCQLQLFFAILNFVFLLFNLLDIVFEIVDLASKRNNLSLRDHAALEYFYFILKLFVIMN